MPVTGDFTELRALKAKFDKVPTEVKKRVSKQVALEAKALVAEGFARGVSPSGQAWPALRSRAGQPLRDTGRLASSIVVTDVGSGFALGTNVPYAAVHQYGATIAAKQARSLYSPRLRQFFGKTVTIPARPFFPDGDSIPGPWEARLAEAAEEALEVFFG